MDRTLSALRTTLFNKYVMAITGLTWVAFTIAHLSSNLLLLNPNPDPYNEYSHKLISLGPLLWLAEILLLVFLAGHIFYGVLMFVRNRRARGSRYEVVGNAGGPSRKTVSSRTMIISGAVIGIFVVIHVWTFKYGPSIDEGYVAEVHGVEMRDLYSLVWEKFQSPWLVAWYVFAMVLLFSHFRHGFWSAFQSLGVHHPRYTPIIYIAGIAIAILLAVGFIFLPVYIFFKG